MNTRHNILPTLTNALLLVIFIFSIWPVAALATGGHQNHGNDKWSTKEWAKKEWSNKDRFNNSHSKKRESGKSCPKKTCDNVLSVPLYVEGDKRVGKVTIRLDGGDLKVSYQVNDGWYIKQTNLDVANGYSSLHLNADGSPDVESYPYNSKHFTPVKSADYTISAGQWPLGTDLYVAAQAVVINKTYGKCKQHSAKSKHGKSDNDSHHKNYKNKKSRGGKHRADHDDFFKKESGHRKYARADHHDDEHDIDHNDGHHDHSGRGKSMEQAAWALGEKFPGQTLAGYFIYKLESCDPTQPSTIQFSDAIYSVNEADQHAVITVTRTGNLDQIASAEFTTLDGSAMNGADYEFTNMVVNFAPGQSSALVMVAVVDDAEVESVETVNLQLSNPLGATLGAQAAAMLEIEDNDVAPASVIAIDRIEPNPVNEGGTVIIYVTRTGDLSSDATVAFGTIDGSAIGATQCLGGATPFDYVQADGTLFFAAGVAELPIEVMTCVNSPRDDAPMETFEIEIYNPTGAVLADDGDGDPNSNLATISIKEGS